MNCVFIKSIYGFYNGAGPLPLSRKAMNKGRNHIVTISPWNPHTNLPTGKREKGHELTDYKWAKLLFLNFLCLPRATVSAQKNVKGQTLPPGPQWGHLPSFLTPWMPCCPQRTGIFQQHLEISRRICGWLSNLPMNLLQEGFVHSPEINAVAARLLWKASETNSLCHSYGNSGLEISVPIPSLQSSRRIQLKAHPLPSLTL